MYSKVNAVAGAQVASRHAAQARLSKPKMSMLQKSISSKLGLLAHQNSGVLLQGIPVRYFGGKLTHLQRGGVGDKGMIVKPG